MTSASQVLGFAARIYLQRAASARAGYISRDPVALLGLAPGRANPYPLYERIRARGPLSPTRRGNWVTVNHRVAASVLRSRQFGVRPEDGSPQGGADLSFLEMNPPDHTRLRRLVQPAFSPRAMAGYREPIERTVAGLLDTAARTAEFDLVPAYAAPLPITVICRLLGVPESESHDFAYHGAVITSAFDGITSVRHAQRLQASSDYLKRLFSRLLTERRSDPGDDIISHLVTAGEEQITAEEMVPLCVLLLIAGFETTVNLIGNAVVALLANRAQWEALCADPAGMAPKAVEETLRFDSPVQGTGRVALQPLELEGKPVRKGQMVLTFIGGANRDPETYDRPGVFDIGRSHPAEHLAFSSGIHYCLGQPLARLEGAIALAALAERMPGLALTGKVRLRNAMTIRGPIHLPVTAESRGTPRTPEPARAAP